MIRSGKFRRFPNLVFWMLLLLVPTGAFNAFAADDQPPMSNEEILRLGKMMYRDGVLPSGEPMTAYVAGDVPVDGTFFTCVSCHLTSGLGSIEGEVITPPTNGRVLYQPREPFIKGSEFVPSYSNYAKYLPVRPAYTDETLADLIATGFDPNGRSVLKVMPRYDIGGKDMDILIAYLKTLSDKVPPGVGDKHLSFATVIVEGADPTAVESMVLPLQFSIDWKNSLATASMANDRVARMAYNMLGDLHSYKFSLSRWILKGPPETWRVQLEEYYQKEPVYALLGGISTGTWEPVHRFCEDNGIPDLFPVVATPVISDQDWYTLYLSRGVRQEGEAAAGYLKEMAHLIMDRTVLQISRDSTRGQALAEGFRTIWEKVGHSPLVDINLPDDTPLTAEYLKRLVTDEKPAVLLIWDDASLLPALSALADRADSPGMIFASGTWLGQKLWDIPKNLRKSVYFTWPYRLPREDKRFDAAAKKVLAGKNPDDYDPIIVRQSFIAQEILGKALMMMRGEYYREFLLDTISMLEDQYMPLYERLSFGPGQRYASKGCFIVQVDSGDQPQLVRRSEWVTP